VCHRARGRRVQGGERDRRRERVEAIIELATREVGARRARLCDCEEREVHERGYS
jgi:hypothetical protein